METQGGKIIEKPNNYTIDAEIGKLEVNTFEIKEGSQNIFRTERDVFPETGPREHYKTVCFRELALAYPCDESYRKSAEKLNRALRRQEGQRLSARTMANLVEREGEQSRHLLRTSRRVSFRIMASLLMELSATRKKRLDC